ncbi:MAG: hypothetical protein H0V92_05885, partial [Pseudonocardiales bacterium]|nr:hypothetical protein [Pseudonocardiales bacterium]
RAAIDAYRTPALQQAVALAVADGTVIAMNVMDEPHVAGQGDGVGGGIGNTWGPPGTMTKLRVDSMCAYVKGVFSTTPTVVSHQWQVFEPTRAYRQCDGPVSIYSARSGELTAWRAGAQAMAARDGHLTMFGLNWINGGTQDKDATWDCRTEGGVIGENRPNCAPTPTQVASWLLALCPRSAGGCLIWTDDGTTAGRNAGALQTVRDSLARLPAVPLRRRP